MKKQANNLNEQRRELLKETAETYTLLNRSIADTYGNAKCLYSPSQKSPGCAIGRKISKELADKLDKCVDSAVDNDEIFVELPFELKKLGKEFLFAIQSLHDDENYWTETGLSECGKKRVENILEKINDNLYGSD